jgi:4-hydroxy-2-oxoheptanedioate aldolase
VRSVIRELEKARALKERLRSGGLAVAAQVVLSDPSIVEILARAGYDLLVVDGEHSAHGPANMQAMLQAGVAGDAVVLARPLRLDIDLIRLYLDLGSPGVVCPFIESAEQAQRLVDSCRYPPAGIRGFGPSRAGGHGSDAAEYFERANESVLCIPIIESETAVANIDEIVAVDGIDAVCIGPVDLSISLRVFQQYESERYVQAVAAVGAACARHGKAMGTGAYSLEHALASRDAGMQLLLTLSDDQALRQAATATLAALR